MKQKNAKEFSIKDLERGLNDCTKSVEEYEKKFKTNFNASILKGCNNQLLEL